RRRPRGRGLEAVSGPQDSRCLKVGKSSRQGKPHGEQGLEVGKTSKLVRPWGGQGLEVGKAKARGKKGQNLRRAEPLRKWSLEEGEALRKVGLGAGKGLRVKDSSRRVGPSGKAKPRGQAGPQGQGERVRTNEHDLKAEKQDFKAGRWGLEIGPRCGWVRPRDVSKYPKKVICKDSAKKQAKISRVKDFIKLVNYNHIMPTCYTIDVDLKDVVNADVLQAHDKKVNAAKETKARLEERFKTGKNCWFFTR
ncbi:hypothetical protein MTR67_001849, partial [Solanum verrucosum]